MQLKQFMTQDLHTIQADQPVRYAAEQMRRHGLGALPVLEREQLIGVITDRDIATGCLASGHEPSTCAVREHMTADPISISADASIDEALAKMGEEQVRRLIVMNGSGPAGIVSLGDLAVHAPANPLVSRTLARISEPIRVPLPA